MAESNNKEVFYVLLGVGITLLAVVTILSFLTYRKVEYQSWQNGKTGTIKDSTIKEEGLGRIQIQSPIYDERNERIYEMLENNQNRLQNHLETINSNVNSLKYQSPNYMPYKMSNQIHMEKENKRSVAGSVTTPKTVDEDRTRQHEFGMI